jgi:hypothetical protein
MKVWFDINFKKCFLESYLDIFCFKKFINVLKISLSLGSDNNIIETLHSQRSGTNNYLYWIQLISLFIYKMKTDIVSFLALSFNVNKAKRWG